MCGIDIHIKSDPRICNNQECIADLEKQERNDKMMRIMFGFGAKVLPERTVTKKKKRQIRNVNIWQRDGFSIPNPKRPMIVEPLVL